MGNLVVVEKNPIPFERLSHLHLEPSAAASKDGEGTTHVKNVLRLFEFCSTSKSSGAEIRPLSAAELETFRVDCCYLCLHTHLHEPGAQGRDKTPGGAPREDQKKKSMVETARIMRDMLSPRGLQTPFSAWDASPVAYERFVRAHLSTETPLSAYTCHDIYAWNGENASTILKAAALTKAFELERALLSADLSNALSRVSEESFVPLGDVFVMDIPPLRMAKPDTMDLVQSNALLRNLLYQTQIVISSDSWSSPDEDEQELPSQMDDSSPQKMGTGMSPLELSQGKSSSSEDESDLRASPAPSPRGKQPLPAPARTFQLKPILQLPVKSDAEARDESREEKYFDDGDEIEEEESPEVRLARDIKVMSKVNDWLFVSGGEVAKNVELVVQNGITHVVNAAPMVYDVKYPQNVSVYRVWVADSASEEVKSMFPNIIDFVREARSVGGRVLFHCHQGVSRSCALAIVSVMYFEHITFNDALAYVKKYRSVCSPNAGFICQLMEFEKEFVFPSVGRTDHLFRIQTSSALYEQHHPVAKEIRRDSRRSIRDYLNSKGCFCILSSLGRCFVYVGGSMHKKKIDAYTSAAIEYMELLKSLFPSIAVGEVTVLHQGGETREFWDTVGGFGDIMDGGVDSTPRNATPLASVALPESMGDRVDGKDDAERDDDMVDDGDIADMDDCGVNESRDAEEVDSPKGRFRLFSWPTFEDFGLFYMDDLVDDEVYVVVDVDALVDGRGSGLAYVWIGEDADVDRSGAGLEKLKSDVTNACSKEGFPVAQVDLEYGGEESEDFWDCFTRG